MEQFNLSNKMKNVYNWNDEKGKSKRDMIMIRKHDVKEFIKLLKEYVKWYEEHHTITRHMERNFDDWLLGYAGEKLI